MISDHSDLLATCNSLVDLIHAVSARCTVGILFTPRNNPCECNHHAAYHLALATIAKNAKNETQLQIL